MKRTTKRVIIAGACGLAVATLALATMMHERHHPQVSGVRLVYTRKGDGGFIPAPPLPAPKSQLSRSSAVATKADPIAPIYAAYNAGDYKVAKSDARQVIAADSHAAKPAVRKNASEARLILAYSYAREHDLKDASVQFAALQQDAAKLPDKGVEPAEPGEVPNTMEAEAAYEHAVCTAALGNKKDAETEYLAFMQLYPDSPYLNGAINRITALHNGQTPTAAFAVWQAARKRSVADDQAQERERALCGPDCLAELLRRQGKPVDVQKLASEMHTSVMGTSLEDLARVARRNGFSARGFALTPKGLLTQQLPLIALIEPGHYVLVDAVSPSEVTIWDPDGNGENKGASRTVSMSFWQKNWSGLALELQPIK